MTTALKVGLAGLGTVGASVVRLIEQQRAALAQRCGQPIEIVAVTARSRAKNRGIDLKKLRWVTDPLALALDSDIDVFVELMGGAGDPAKVAVEAALRSGKSVVTANKALLAKHGVKLAALAERNHVALNFEAAVAGGIPIVKTLREGLVGNKLARIYGILNGTCNYILTRMEQEGLSFADCLKDAQRLGYAEADPTFDIEGHDTAQKLSILASLAFGVQVDPTAIYVEGISSIATEDLSWAEELGYRVKLLGVPNAVTVDADAVHAITLVGPGAGGMATASAVVADIGDIARGVRTPPFGRATDRLAVSKKAPMQRHEGGYYIRLLARDRPGSAATIARRLAEQDISIESIVQRHAGTQGGNNPGKAAPVPVILITYATTEDAVRRALAAVRRDRVISGSPQVIRIEKN